MPLIPEWSPVQHMEVMDRLGIATSLLSISSPGVHLGDGSTTVTSHTKVNEEGRRAVVDHRGRFGLLASLPLPDVDATIAEIAHCCDHLNVDGFVLLSNISGVYVSDKSFEPVFRELDRRHARVLLHPTSPACWEHTSFDRPRPMLEFFFDTTRVVVDLVLNGTIADLSRDPDDLPPRRRHPPSRCRPCECVRGQSSLPVWTCFVTSAAFTSIWRASPCRANSTRSCR